MGGRVPLGRAVHFWRLPGHSLNLTQRAQVSAAVAAAPEDAFATEAETHPAGGGGLKPTEMVSSSEAGGRVGQGLSNCLFVVLSSLKYNLKCVIREVSEKLRFAY
jgi:hypothetical protein